MWDPTSYLRYGDERSRPFHDLIARVPADRPAEVVDLGCGPGTLTAGLVHRWPGARIRGLDASPEMIDKARGLGSTVDFVIGDVADWVPGPDVRVVISNAVLHWVPGHEELLRRWAATLTPGGWLAVQVPGSYDAPAHRALRTLAAESRWRDRLASTLGANPVREPVEYAALLTAAGCQVDAWETTYVHLLSARDAVDHPVLAWMEGTALRPVRAALGGDGRAWTDFRAALGERLAEAYPIRDGQVYFPFRRVFFVARVGARPAGPASDRPAGSVAPVRRENP